MDKVVEEMQKGNFKFFSFIITVNNDSEQKKKMY